MQGDARHGQSQRKGVAEEPLQRFSFVFSSQENVFGRERRVTCCVSCKQQANIWIRCSLLASFKVMNELTYWLLFEHGLVMPGLWL
jgi:hypothetical protein